MQRTGAHVPTPCARQPRMPAPTRRDLPGGRIRLLMRPAPQPGRPTLDHRTSPSTGAPRALPARQCARPAALRRAAGGRRLAAAGAATSRRRPTGAWAPCFNDAPSQPFRCLGRAAPPARGAAAVHSMGGRSGTPAPQRGSAAAAAHAVRLPAWWRQPPPCFARPAPWLALPSILPCLLTALPPLAQPPAPLHPGPLPACGLPCSWPILAAPNGHRRLRSTFLSAHPRRPAPGQQQRQPPVGPAPPTPSMGCCGGVQLRASPRPAGGAELSPACATATL